MRKAPFCRTASSGKLWVMTPQRLIPDALLGDATVAARRLLGCHLVRQHEGVLQVGRIVETEAYCEGDPASHSCRGRTARNASMFAPAGTAYVYLIYGLNHCLNVVTGPEGYGAAVLLRALEPIEGMELMAANRGRATDLMNGPGKLCQALGIDRSLDGEDLLTSESLYLLESPPLAESRILATPRIGITQGLDRLWRFVDKESPQLSRKLAHICSSR